MNAGIKIIKKNDTNDLVRNGLLVYTGLDDMDAENYANPDIIIDHSGVVYNGNSLPYSSRISVNFPRAPLTLYKATNDTKSPQVPGFMAFSVDEVAQYLPGGTRHRHYGGNHLIRADVKQIEISVNAETIDTANFGNILILPGTPMVIDISDVDGVVVLQSVVIEIENNGPQQIANEMEE
jgi:hypothetical protein